MNDICRLCLSINKQEMYKLSEECDILHKIRSSLTIQIHIQKSLPELICNTCLKKIEEIYEFHKYILENQKKLQQCLDKGISILQKFYENLINSEDLNNDYAGSEKNCKINFVKVEVDNYDNDTEINDDNFLHPLNDENKVHEQRNHNEDIDINSDDIPLSLEKIQSNVSYITFENKTDNKPNKNNAVQINCTKNDVLSNPFTCLTCFEVLESQIYLIKHYNNEHNSNEEVIELNTLLDGNTTKYKCDVCDEMFDEKRDIIKHMAVHKRPFICKVCGRTYKTVTEIVRHSRAHNGFKLQCSYQCGFLTAYKGALKDHEKRHLEKPDYKYRCSDCGKGFLVKTWYEQHQNVHKGLKPFICDLCGIAFHMERYLTAHRKTVHQQVSHVKRYVCVHCLFRCDTTNSLADHLKVHGIKTEFLCDECGKVFKNSDKLKNHKITHLQIKPYSCSICSKAFAKKFTMKLHERAHTGERLYACAHCNKKYVQKATLHRHYRRNHSGLSPSNNC